tara:strand:+ start:1098 stop:1700 length:603 start_codon:yes stop_codon:yes gene_type:complete
MSTYTDIRYDYNLPSGFGGALQLIKEQTASSSASISFVDGTSGVVLDSTYRTYIFKFINIHPSASGANFGFQVDTGTNTSYAQTITSTFFEAVHGEDGSGGALSYKTAKDQAQGTGLQSLGQPGNETDLGMSGSLHLFEPSSSVFVKHFIARSNLTENGGVASDNYIGGYINTTTAITRVQFKSSSGTLDSGVIKLYGIA